MTNKQGCWLLLWVLTGLAALQGIGLAQNDVPQFEVASIHEVVDGVRVMGEFKASGARVEYQGFSVPMLIAEAWKIRGDEVALGAGVAPATVYPMMAAGRSAHVFDIVAVAREGTTPTRDEFRTMLQSLLATRFKLITHSEKRDKPVYVLARDGGLQLKVNSGDGSCHVNASRTPEGQKIVATHCPIETLIRTLLVDRPVYDGSGLTGFYDFESTSALPSQTGDAQAIMPFSAVKELGLKLEAKQRPIEMVVIDHVEAPGEN